MTELMISDTTSSFYLPGNKILSNIHCRSLPAAGESSVERQRSEVTRKKTVEGSFEKSFASIWIGEPIKPIDWEILSAQTGKGQTCRLYSLILIF
jgi:hypothetical protein